MQIPLPFNNNKPIAGEASVEIKKPLETVFSYVGEDFFTHYPKWATEVVEFEPLDGKSIFVGAKAKQIRNDTGSSVESVFEIIDYQPYNLLALQGIAEPYKQIYMLEPAEQLHETRLIFRFQLLELDLFMRPFEKLIRSAIEEGAEHTVENIKSLLEN